MNELLDLEEKKRNDDNTARNAAGSLRTDWSRCVRWFHRRAACVHQSR